MLLKDYPILSLIFSCIVLASCDEPYVSKEQRLTFTECQKIFFGIQTFVREVYLDENHSIDSMSAIADTWTDSEIGKKHQQFEEQLDICAYKQFAARKTGEYVGPNYERSYAALRSINISVQAFSAERKAQTGIEELKGWLSLIESMAIKITGLYDSR